MYKNSMKKSINTKSAKLHNFLYLRDKGKKYVDNFFALKSFGYAWVL